MNLRARVSRCRGALADLWLGVRFPLVVLGLGPIVGLYDLAAQGFRHLLLTHRPTEAPTVPTPPAPPPPPPSLAPTAARFVIVEFNQKHATDIPGDPAFAPTEIGTSVWPDTTPDYRDHPGEAPCAT